MTTAHGYTRSVLRTSDHMNTVTYPCGCVLEGDHPVVTVAVLCDEHEQELFGDAK